MNANGDSAEIGEQQQQHQLQTIEVKTDDVPHEVAGETVIETVVEEHQQTYVQLPEGTHFVDGATIAATINERGELVQVNPDDPTQDGLTEIIFINVNDQQLEDEVILIEEDDTRPPPAKRQKVSRTKTVRVNTTTAGSGAGRESIRSSPCSYAVQTMFLLCTETGCDLRFSDKKTRNAHVIQAHKLRPYVCPVTTCADRFDTSGLLSTHVRESHSGVTKWKCPKCPNEFKKYKLLYMHMWIMHDEGYFKCPHNGCDFEATYRKQVYNHIDHRHQEAKNVCPFEGCTKAFTTKNELKAHERRVHLMLKPYRCKWPGCSYSSEVCPAVIRHIRTQHFHLPETMRKQREKNIVDFRDPKEYLEIICDPNRVYAVLTPAVNEQASKRYVCPYEGCSKEFLRAANLKVHQRTHLGLRPFQCKWPNCKMATERRDALISHIRTDHFNLPRSAKEQKQKNVNEMRDPNEFVEVLTEQFDDPTTKALVAAMAASSGIAAQNPASMVVAKLEMEDDHEITFARPRAPPKRRPAAAGGGLKGGKPVHACTYAGCGKTFRRPANLKDHERIHMGIKPYQCAYGSCQFASGRKENVIQHIRTNHFHLPRSLKEQKAKNIEDLRDPTDYIEVATELLGPK